MDRLYGFLWEESSLDIFYIYIYFLMLSNVLVYDISDTQSYYFDKG